MIHAIAALTARRGVARIVLLVMTIAIVAASALTPLVFPLLAGIPAWMAVGPVAVTAAVVAFPLGLVLVRTIHDLDRKRRELAVKEERLLAAQRLGRLGHWRFDLQSGRIWLSETVHELLGDPDGSLAMTAPVLRAMTHPEDRGVAGAALTRMLADGSTEQLEYRITGLDGAERTFWIDGRPMLGPDGRPVGAYGACQDITERKRMQSALRESEDHFRHAVELSPQIPWTADPEGRVLEAGPRWSRIVGLPEAAALGDGWLNVVHSDDRSRIATAWRDRMRTGEPADNEYRIRTADGSYRWFRARATARRDATGAITRWYGALEDIHDQKTADAALREGEAFIRSILESSTVCVKVLDLEGDIRFVNAPGLRLLEEEDAAHVLGKAFGDGFPAASRQSVRGALATARAGGVARFTAFCPTARGTEKWWEITVSPITAAEGRPLRLLAISRDVTDTKRAQDALEAAKASSEAVARRLRAVLESTTDCVLFLDHAWRFAFLNPGATAILAGGRELLGRNIWEVFPDARDGSFGQRYREAVETRRSVHFEQWSERFGVWFEVNAYPTEEGLSIFFRDVTERREHQAEITRRMEEAKAASRAKSEFLATMSHEIRTPMHGMLGLAEQLGLGALDDDQRLIVAELRASGQALVGIIDDVLDFSKIEAGAVTVEALPTDLRAMLEGLGRLFRPEAAARGIDVVVEIDPALAACHRTDPGRLRQILTNLAANAVKFTETGSVRLSATAEADGPEAQRVCLAVIDTGIGIDPGVTARIFRPFEQADASTTRRFGGTGLGLAISERLAAALGGTISVASVPGRGSSFTLSLPLRVLPEEAARSRGEADDPALPDVAATRVLVAEDNRVNRLILERILARAGCATAFVENGAEAVAAAAAADYDIVLMDISMPELDGYGAARAIRAAEAEGGQRFLPIVALTAHVGPEHAGACRASGIQAMLSKPFRRAEILAAIAANARRAEPAHSAPGKASACPATPAAAQA